MCASVRITLTLSPPITSKTISEPEIASRIVSSSKGTSRASSTTRRAENSGRRAGRRPTSCQASSTAKHVQPVLSKVLLFQTALHSYHYFSTHSTVQFRANAALKARRKTRNPLLRLSDLSFVSGVKDGIVKREVAVRWNKISVIITLGA